MPDNLFYYASNKKCGLVCWSCNWSNYPYYCKRVCYYANHEKNIYTCMTFSMWLVKITTLGIFTTVKQMKKKSDWFLPNNDSSNFYYCMNHYYSSWNGVNVSEACFFTFVNIKFIVDDLFLLLSPNFLCSNKITIWLVKITTISCSDAILTSQVVTFTTLLLVLPQWCKGKKGQARKMEYLSKEKKSSHF